jgi:serine/threonine protein kinase
MSNIQIIKSHSLKSDKSSNNYKKSSTIIGNYEIIKTIGEGTFGKVKLAKNIPSNELVAIKILENIFSHPESDYFSLGTRANDSSALTHSLPST